MKSTLRIVAVAATISLLAMGCGSNDPGSSVVPATGQPSGSAPGASDGGAPVAISGELNVWAMGNEGTLLGTLADAFMTEYPDVKVNVTPVDWEQAVTKLQTAIGGHQTPDVSQMGTDMMGQFAATGALETIPAGIDPSQYFESAWNTGVVDGTAYGVPWYVETRVLYYRTDLATAAGITKAPGSWAELKAMAKALQAEGSAEWGISLGTKNSQEYLPFLWSNGGQIVDDAGAFTLDSPEAIEALTYYDSFFEEGLSPKSVPTGFDITPAFVSGTHPMFVSGPWHVGLIETAGGAAIEGKWAVVPLPGKDGPPGVSWVGGANLVVYKDSKNKDAAWAFVEFISRPETQVLWYQTATVLPAVQAAWDDQAIASDERVAVFGEQLASTNAPPPVTTWNEIATAINEQLEKVTAGETSPEDGAKAMQQAAESIGAGG